MGEKTYLSLASIGEDAEELGVFFFLSSLSSGFGSASKRYIPH